MILWLVLAVMAMLAVAFVVPPLLGDRAPRPGRRAHDIAVYRDQLDEVARDRERGVIGEDDAEAARREIERRLLAADAASRPDAPTRSLARAAAPLLAVLVPAAALLVYFALGAPEAPRRLAEATPTPSPTAIDPDRLADLEAATEADPADGTAWATYGAALGAAGRYDEAAQAYAEAIANGRDGAGVHSARGEALTLAAGGTVTPRAADAFAAALAANSRDPRARYYSALAAFQAGRTEQALETWVALERDSPAGAPWRTPLAARIEEAAAQAGIDPATLDRAPTPGPTEEDVAAAVEMSAEDRQAMIETMVAGLAARLEQEPDDLAGWRRLARSYEVLGRPADARDAMARAAELAPDDPEILMERGRLAYEAAGRPEDVPAEVTETMQRVLALDADNALALWFVGVAEAAAGDTAAARRTWQRLLGRLEPGTPQYDNLEARIEALPASP